MCRALSKSSLKMYNRFMAPADEQTPYIAQSLFEKEPYMCRALFKMSHKNVEEIHGETSRFTAPADELMSRLPRLCSLLYKRDLYV